jgi:hypothetical protein
MKEVPDFARVSCCEKQRLDGSHKTQILERIRIDYTESKSYTIKINRRALSIVGLDI